MDKKRIPLLAALLIQCSFVHAAFLPPPLSAPLGIPVDIYGRDDVATVKFKTIGGQCTGVYISPEGYILTALHCLHKCLIENTAVAKSPAGETLEGVYEIDQNALSEGKAHCKAWTKETNIVDAEIVATGNGFLTVDAENDLLSSGPGALEKFIGYRMRGFGTGDDYAVIKVPQTKKAVCADLATSDPMPHDSIWSLGYPAKTYRPEGGNSDGLSKWFTVGLVNSSVLQNQCFPEVLTWSDEDQNAARWLYDIPEGLWTTLDATNGSSGAPTFDSSGRVNGIMILTRTKEGPRTQYCSGGTEILKIGPVIQKLRKKMNNEKFAEVATCSR